MHGGEHLMKSGDSRAKSVYSQDMRSVHTSGEHLNEMSSVRVSCHASLHTRETERVPEHKSQVRMFLVPVVQCCNSLWPHEHSRAYEAH